MKASVCFVVSSCLTIATAACSIPPPGPDGKYTLRSIGISASFIPYSAAVTNLFIADRNGTVRDVVLGYDNASYYESDPIHPNYGAIPGRYANRIGNATYVLDGKRYYTDRNDGNSTMHTGTKGWSYRIWNVTHISSNSITFAMSDDAYSSPGMPGFVQAQVIYTLTPYTWTIRIEAVARTHNTPLMATNHAYWNLDAFANPANDTVLNHTLCMPFSRRQLAYDAIAQVNGTILDIPEFGINDFFTAPKHIGANTSAQMWLGNCGPGVGGYDCAWTIDHRDTRPKNPWPYVEPVASLWSDWSGIRWDLYSNQAGMAMTSCGFFPSNTLRIKMTQGGPGAATNGFVPPSGCVAVEPQDWTSGIQYPDWGREPYQIYGPKDGTYVNEMVYRFSVQ